MPYIKQEQRKELDPEIWALIQKLEKDGFNEGQTNYVFSRILKYAFDKNPRYSEINKIMGILSSVQAEFYRRFASKLEDEKILENGDI